jgi:adenosylmethionine-8-amino-7-oxononanoate aminotransferase
MKNSKSGFLIRDDGSEDIIISHAENSFLFAQDGRKYIDFTMGWCVGNLGWGSQELPTKTNNTKRPVYVLPKYQYGPWTALAKMLADIIPGDDLNYSVRTTGGTESIEAAMQMAIVHTGRTKFLSIEGSYHGNSIGALSIGSSENKKTYKGLLPDCHKIEPPLDRKAADKVEKRLKRKDIAAFIMEPIIMNLAVTIPEPEFMERVADLCRHYDTLFVIDEVATGFGRTGKLFGFEHYQINPDILCLAKAITGGHAGLGATVTTAKIAKSLKQKKFSFYSTYGWHPLAVDAAIANIAYMSNHKEKLLSHVQEMNAFFTSSLQEMKFKKKIELRSKGLAIAVNVSQSKYAESIRKKCQDEGLLMTAQDENLVLFPALNIDKKTARNGLQILEQSL